MIVLIKFLTRDFEWQNTISDLADISILITLNLIPADMIKFLKIKLPQKWYSKFEINFLTNNLQSPNFRKIEENMLEDNNKNNFENYLMDVGM